MTTARSITWFNRIYLAVFVAGAAWSLLEGQVLFGAALAAGAGAVAVSIVRATRGRGSDFERVSAVQPFDERDRAASTWSFAVVGMAAIILQTVVLLTQILRDGRADLLVAGESLSLFAVWAAAVWVAVRRG